MKRRVACRGRVSPGRSHLHIHNVGIGLHHAVAHVQSGLKADLGFLHGDHGFFQADRRVFHLHFALQAR